MATRGVFQCMKLTLRYCEHGGSSRAVRDYLASGQLIEWAKERPSVKIKVMVNNGRHPNVQADYVTSSVSNKSALSKPVIHQICLKSKGIEKTKKSHSNKSHPIEDALNQLYNKSGRKMTKFTKPVYTDTPSIQGVWTPSLDLHLLTKNQESKFNLKIIQNAR